MRSIAIAAVLFAAAHGATSASFDFPNFGGRSQQLNLAGAAVIKPPVLRLTPAKKFHAGAAWYPEKLPVTAGFDTTFRFRLTDQGGLGKGADGLAFVLQNHDPEAIAGRGSAGGWAMGDGEGRPNSPGIPRAIAVFFDTFKNEEDPSDNYLAICNNGGPKEMQWPPPRLAVNTQLPFNLKDRHVHAVRIRYRPPVLSVFVDDAPEPTLVTAVDISLVTDSTGHTWAGFTASTGAGFENHNILSWSFTATETSSAMVSSNISFFMGSCLPGRNLCTPAKAIVEESEPGRFHIVLPANLPWGASIPNPGGGKVVIENAQGTVCYDLKAKGAEGCGGPGQLLLQRNRDGKTWFSIDDPRTTFADNEGYFEFDAILSSTPEQLR